MYWEMYDKAKALIEKDTCMEFYNKKISILRDTYIRSKPCSRPPTGKRQNELAEKHSTR